jgi:hypothetical protein
MIWASDSFVKNNKKYTNKKRYSLEAKYWHDFDF